MNSENKDFCGGNIMKKLLMKFLVFSVVLLMLSTTVVLAEVPTVKLKLLTSQEVYQNGDKVSVEGKGFAENDKSVIAVLIVHNANGSIDYKILQDQDLTIDASGNIIGSATIEGIDETDRFAQFVVSAKYSSVVPTEKFAVQGDLPNFSTQMNTEAGTFSFTEAGGDNIADLNEQFNITTPNSGWTPPTILPLLCFRREYSTGDGSGSPVASASLPVADLQIVGDQLEGFTNNGSQAYDPSTQTMRLDVFDGSFTFGTSTNYFRTFADTIPPNLTSAYATALDTIKLVFDEAVSEVGGGDAAAKFDFSLGSGVSASAVLPVGTEPTTMWNLVISGLTDRSVSNLTVAYDSLNTGSTELEDGAGNIVKNTSPAITVADSIAPGATTLRNSANSAALTVGEFIGNTTYILYARVTDGANDPSLDGVVFEGSDNGTSWAAIGTDTSVTASGSDADFSVVWACSTAATQYKILRASAFDNAGASGTNNALDADDNVTFSTVVGTPADNLNNNFEDSYRAVITSVSPDPISASSGSVRSQITMEVQNNYGTPTNTTGQNNTFRFRETTTTTETWWNAATGGNSFITSIDTTLASSATSLDVWYSNNAAGGPNTLVLQEPAGNFAANSGVVSANGETITVQTGTASKIWVQLPGQTFVSGTGVTSTPNDSTVTDTLVVGLFVTDDANNLVDFNETRDLEFETNANNAPDATPPSVNSTSISSSSATTISITFVSGADSVFAHFPAAQTGVTLAVSDTTLTDTLGAVTSSGVNILHGPLQDFAFVMTSPQRDGLPVTGVNTLTARDEYQNPVTSFNAATNNVTVTKNTGPGTTTITGLGSANNNVLNQAGDFVNGVADLTAQGMTIDVSITGNYTLVATSSVVPARTGISNSFAVNRVVDVSNPNTAARTIIDTSATATDPTLRATISGGEDPSVGDDFRIVWGFNTTGNFGRPYGLERQSPDRTPGTTIEYVVPVSDIQNLGAPYDYMFWWVENLSTNPNATILQGLPTADNARRLILNPNLITQGGINGGDVAQGNFTPGVSNQEMVSIVFSADPNIATIKINSISFTKTGTATDSDVPAYHLYRDGGTLGTFDSGIDLLLASYTGGGTTITFSPLTDLLNITGIDNYILVTVDVSSGANPNNTLGLHLNNQGNITLDDNVYNGPASAITKNPFSNLGTAGDYSLPVNLSSFQARAGYGNIQLEWTTASEENNAGFYLMRSEDPEGEFVRLNSELIEGSGNANTSNSYSYTDAEIASEVTYYYKLYSVDYNGDVYAYNTLASGTAMALPKSFAIYQNYPNPFNPTTRLKFDVPKQAEISIEIYNMLGQKVRTLVNNEVYQPGVYDNIIWDARDDRGNQVANGIYYMVFSARNFDFRQVRKLVFMK